MEREPPEVARRLMRAARSLNYNRELQPLVEERIERAEGTLRDYLMANGRTALRLGAFQVEMDEEGEIHLSRLPMDEWQQMRLLKEPVPDGQGETADGARGSAVAGEEGCIFARKQSVMCGVEK